MPILLPVRTLFHVAHGLLIGIGAIAVLATLLPGSGRYRRSVKRLRQAGSSDALIHLAEQRAHAELSGPAEAGPQGRPLLVVAALASTVAAVIHGAVGPEHFREALRLGLFFVLICAGQLFLAAALLRRPARVLVACTIVVNAGTVLLWILTRTCGLPAGLAEVEPVGVLDTISSAAELVVVGCCLRWLLLGQIHDRLAKHSPRRPFLTALSANRQEGV
jgi:hypothetical protein